MSIEQAFERLWGNVTATDEISSRSPAQKALAKRFFVAGAQTMKRRAAQVLRENPKAKGIELRPLIEDLPIEGREEENWEPDNI